MQTLLQAAQAYMNVLADTATLELNRNNVEVLEEQLRQTRDRFNVGEVTPHRRGPGRGAARRGPGPGQPGRGEPAHQHRDLRQVIGVEPRQLAPAARSTASSPAP